MNIEGKNIVITGGTSGIGLALAKVFHKMGGKLWIVSRNQKKLEQMKKLMNNKINIYTCDLKNQDEVDGLFKTLFTKTETWSGQVDIFIANAGFAYYERYPNYDWAHMQDIYNLNVFSPIYCLGKMTENSGGRVFQYVLISSGVAKYPLPGFSLYASSKSATDTFSQAYNWEKNSNIILSTVYPIAVKTPLYNKGETKIPIPLMRQDLKSCVTNIAIGIIQNKKYIYPSRLFHLGLYITPFLPVNLIFSYLEKKRLEDWSKK